MMQCSRALARRLIRRLERRGEQMSPERYIVLVFLALILLGSALLCLPVASRNGHSCGFGTALFTATSATCVTGLSLVDTYTQWSGFGQVVLLVLIRVGGLGFMTIACVFFLMLRRRIGLARAGCCWRRRWAFPICQRNHRPGAGTCCAWA